MCVHVSRRVRVDDLDVGTLSRCGHPPSQVITNRSNACDEECIERGGGEGTGGVGAQAQGKGEGGGRWRRAPAGASCELDSSAPVSHVVGVGCLSSRLASPTRCPNPTGGFDNPLSLQIRLLTQATHIRTLNQSAARTMRSAASTTTLLLLVLLASTGAAAFVCPRSGLRLPAQRCWPAGAYVRISRRGLGLSIK